MPDTIGADIAIPPRPVPVHPARGTEAPVSLTLSLLDLASLAMLVRPELDRERAALARGATIGLRYARLTHLDRAIRAAINGAA